MVRLFYKIVGEGFKKKYIWYISIQYIYIYIYIYMQRELAMNTQELTLFADIYFYL